MGERKEISYKEKIEELVRFPSLRKNRHTASATLRALPQTNKNQLTTRELSAREKDEPRHC